jgi:hypothetical protein
VRNFFSLIARIAAVFMLTFLLNALSKVRMLSSFMHAEIYLTNIVFQHTMYDHHWLYFNLHFKILVQASSDEHIFKFLRVKFGFDAQRFVVARDFGYILGLLLPPPSDSWLISGSTATQATATMEGLFYDLSRTTLLTFLVGGKRSIWSIAWSFVLYAFTL